MWQEYVLQIPHLLHIQGLLYNILEDVSGHRWAHFLCCINSTLSHQNFTTFYRIFILHLLVINLFRLCFMLCLRLFNGILGDADEQRPSSKNSCIRRRISFFVRGLSSSPSSPLSSGSYLWFWASPEPSDGSYHQCCQYSIVLPYSISLPSPAMWSFQYHQTGSSSLVLLSGIYPWV